jgi:hypothetical protein
VPTIAIEGIYKLTINANDHPPPHTHVRWSGDEVRIELRGLQPLDPFAGKLKPIVAAVRKHRRELIAAWDRYHP